MTAFETPPGVEPDSAASSRPDAVSVALPDRIAYTSRVVADASTGTPVSLFLTFGGIPRRAAARIVSSGTEPGPVRRADPAGLPRGPRRPGAAHRFRVVSGRNRRGRSVSLDERPRGPAAAAAVIPGLAHAHGRS